MNTLNRQCDDKDRTHARGGCGYSGASALIIGFQPRWLLRNPRVVLRFPLEWDRCQRIYGRRLV